jgi:hypothetical protein
MKTKLFQYFCAVVLGLALTAAPAAAQVQWYPNQTYDEGQQPALAVHPSGLVLEFHRTQDQTSNTLWYYVGRVDGTRVNWGASQRAPADGSWPNVAITSDGYVLFVWSTGNAKSSSALHYMVGMVDPNGDNQQSIKWLSIGKSFDAGFHSSMAMNDHGVIVEVHESGTGGSGMFYRVGHFADLAGGNYNITWDSGGNGRHYDNGINPHIAINNRNEVVEVHQVSGETFLHYRRGVVLSGGLIDFRASQRYDDYGTNPVVALLDSGQVVEAHVEGSPAKVTCSPGRLNLSNPERIDWSNRVAVTGVQAKQGAIATNGTQFGPRVAVGSWPAGGSEWKPTIYLHSVVGTIDGP